jgi:beta-glucosidase
MTSFSRIGATPVNGHVGMMINILREEWGFNGLVTTDMMNNAAYFRPEMCIYTGITQIADFSRNETMEDVVKTWNYFTEDVIAKDQDLVNMVRRNMKYQLYAFSQSAIVNVKTTAVTPWWESALNTSIYVCAGLSILCLVMYVLPLVNKKKEEV